MIYVTILTALFMLTKCGSDPYWPEDDNQPVDGGMEENVSIGFLPKVYYDYEVEDVVVAPRWDRMPSIWLPDGQGDKMEITEPGPLDDDLMLLYFVRSDCSATAEGMTWVEDLFFELYRNRDISVTVSIVVDGFKHAQKLKETNLPLYRMGNLKLGVADPPAPFFSAIDTDKHPNEVRGYPQLFILQPDTNEILSTIAGSPKTMQISDYVDLIVQRLEMANNATF